MQVKMYLSGSSSVPSYEHCGVTPRARHSHMVEGERLYGMWTSVGGVRSKKEDGVSVGVVEEGIRGRGAALGTAAEARAGKTARRVARCILRGLEEI